MDEKRKGEIALKVLLGRMRGEGLHLKYDEIDSIREKTEELGVPFEDAKKFVEIIVRDFVDDFFKRLKEAPDEATVKTPSD